jgi:orotate phosphoribosyltransferase
MSFDREAYDRFLVDNGCIGFFDPPITLKSGRPGHWYANMRRLMDSRDLVDRTVQFMRDFLYDAGIDFDYPIGVPEGATKLGTFLSYALDKNIVMARGRVKGHGASIDRRFIGPVQEGDNICPIEDVTTTGGSLITFIEDLRDSGLYVASAIALANRLERVTDDDPRGVPDVLREMEVSYHSLTDARTVLPLAYGILKPGEEVGRRIEDYFRRYGTVDMSLV